MAGRLIVLGRKKLIWTAVMVIGVMMPLMVASYRVAVEDAAGTVGQVLTYSSEKEGFKFAYPQGWLLRVEKDFSGGEILENVTFACPEQTAHGFVQVMKLGKTIPEYIEDSKKAMAPGYDSLKFGKTKANGQDGYLLTYGRGQGDLRITAVEHFFERGEKVYRFSYFYRADSKERYLENLEEMLQSFVLPD
ncbi:MAG: hypothetical protein CVU89_12925 [Firmicutes bacterium HGW-Firmicutes-14]|nr:MAG: hypothetical protein CVU89_12925 [Firmicutes bacterium HGW-Firmicutes-14]